LPFQEKFQIVTPYPADPCLEPWKGMAVWSKTDEARNASVTRADWMEKGGEYIKEHSWGNWSDDDLPR
jgi:actin-related protein 5